MPTLAEAGAGRTPENKVSPVTPRCSAVGGANGGWHGAYGWSNKEDAEPVNLISAGLPCLKRGCLVKTGSARVS